MIRLPKVSDPADLMMRNSLYQAEPVRPRYIGCPASNLFNPVIPPAVGKVENLMTMSREEMAEIIARQQGEAEKTIQNLRENQQEQLEAPASAMEEYYMAILKDIRQREQAEIDNAYLTQQQKNDLQASALARKAGIDGNLVRYADELAKKDADLMALAERLKGDAVEQESRMAMTADPATRPATIADDDEMGRQTAARMASAAGSASAMDSAEPMYDAETLRGFDEELEGMRASIRPSVSGMTKKQYLRENGETLLRRFDSLVSNLQARGLAIGSRVNYIQEMAGAIVRADTDAITSIFTRVKQQIRNAGRRI